LPRGHHTSQTVGPCCLVALKQSEGGCAAIIPGGAAPIDREQAAPPCPLHRLFLGIGMSLRFAAALLFPNRASGALHAVAMDRKSGFFRAHLDTTTGTPDLSGSNTRRLHTCRMNPAFLANAASCVGGSVRVRPLFPRSQLSPRPP